jgi:epidermal growth factor receptor substrate 15
LILLLGFTRVYSQDTPKSETELKAKADALFIAHKYIEALPAYSQLLSLYPTSGEYNYKYGACMLYGDANKEKSFQHLRYAIGKPGVPPEVHYYLGKAYHLNYLFADAIEQFEKYKSMAVGRKDTKIDVELALQQCRNGKTLLSRVKDITVLNKVEVREADFFRSYDLSDIGGRILVCPEELLSGFDKKTGERFLMYYPGNTSTVFYSSYGKDDSRGRDIYRATRTPSGGWSKPIPMTGINTAYDDNFPYLHPDGKTFYFASKGHSSMGGYDIFKCEYNEATDSFTQPENLDFAINTPDDDIFYITDKDNNLAYFASGRSSEQSLIHVYQVKVAANALQLVFIKGKFASKLPGVGLNARILVQDATTNTEVGEYLCNAQGDYIIDIPRSGRFKFTVTADGASKSHTEIVEIPASNEMAAYGQQMELTTSNSIEKLIITNQFDKPLQEDLFALAQGILKYRAGLDVNANGDVAKLPPAKGGSVSGAYKDAGFAENLSNEEVLAAVKKQTESLDKKGAEMREQMNYAYTLAQQKKDKAAKEARDAQDFLRLADAVSDEKISQKYFVQSAAAKQKSEKLAAEASTALGLARQLNERLVEIEQMEQASEAQAIKLNTAFQSNEYEKTFEALKAVKEAQDKQNTTKSASADEYMLLRQKSADNQKSAEVATKMTQSLRDEEQSLRNRIKSRTQQMESAKVKDRPAIQLEIDALQSDLNGVESQIKKLYADVESSQVNANVIVNQAELYRKIAEGNTDTYIPTEKLLTFREEDAQKIEKSIRDVESETAAMKDNTEVVQRILTEDSNLALEAFGSKEAMNAYTESRNIESPVKTTAQSNADPQQRIQAAEDWINVINESVIALETERKKTNNEVRRAEIDKELADFQALKFKKVEEIDEAREELAVAETPSTKETGATTNTSISEPDQLIARVSPQYQKQLDALQNSNLKSTEKQKRKIELDKDFVATLDTKIATAETAKPVPGTEAGDELELMKLLRKQKTEDIAFEQDLLAREEGGVPERTSTEILMSAYGMTEDEPKEEIVPKPVVKAEPTADVARPVIPESIDYKDIDPTYQEAIKLLESSGINEEARLREHNNLNAQFIQKIDSRIAGFNQLESSKDAVVQRQAMQARSQLNMIRQVTLNEIAANNQELADIESNNVVAGSKLITDEIDPEYAENYLAIDKIEDNDYIKTISRARLEQKTVAKIDEHIATLVKQMDATSNNEQKEALQEKVQEFQTIRSEKVVAYESLFAKADQIAKGEEVAAAAPVKVAEPATFTETPKTESTEKSDIAVSAPISTQPAPAYDFESALKAGVATGSFGLDKISEYTVFADVAELRYKSLNAMLDYEGVEGDLQRHHSRLRVFAATNKNQNLSQQAEAEYEELLLTEVRLQKAIAEANTKEMDFYETGNRQLLRSVEVMPGIENHSTLMADIEAARKESDNFKRLAAEKRNQADATKDISSKLRMNREAFELEVKAIEKQSSVNDWLNTASSKGLAAASTYKSQPAVVAVRPQLIAETPLIAESAKVESKETEVTPPQKVAEAINEAVAVETSSDNEYIAFSSKESMNKRISSHFSLSTEEMQLVNANPLYLEWFKTQFAADSLDAVKRIKIKQAEMSLDEAERKLRESEKIAAEAESEEDEERQKIANDRAQRLQMEAQELYRLAQKLKQEIDQYNSSSSDAKAQADILLQRIPEADAARIRQMADMNEDVAVLKEQVAPPVRQNPVQQPVNTQINREEPLEAIAEQPATPVRAETVAEQKPAPVTTPVSPGKSSTEMVDAVLTGSLPNVVTRDLFEQRSAAVYSANNPIPVSSEWPEGLIFAVQVGAFRNPIPQDLFSGFTPIRGELLSNGITRYTAGVFLSFDNANGAKNDIRGLGYSDAFVVAYLNGQRIPLNRALNQQQATEIIAQAAPGNRVTQPAANNQTAVVSPQQTTNNSTQTTTTPVQTNAVPEKADVAQSTTERATPVTPTTTPVTNQPATSTLEKDRQVVEALVSKPFVARSAKSFLL